MLRHCHMTPPLGGRCNDGRPYSIMTNSYNTHSSCLLASLFTISFDRPLVFGKSSSTIAFSMSLWFCPRSTSFGQRAKSCPFGPLCFCSLHTCTLYMYACGVYTIIYEGMMWANHYSWHLQSGRHTLTRLQGCAGVLC